jgi:ligand-binding sensor domain-containing protein
MRGMGAQEGFSTTIHVITVTCLIVATSGFVSGARPEWETITSFRDVRKMCYLDDTLWVATSGGLLAVTDPDSHGRTFDNLDGLGTVDITDIIEDADGQKWVTGLGRLIKFTQQSPRQFLFEKDNTLLELRRVVDDGDNLWIGTSIGLVLFSKSVDGGQIQDSYGQFGNLNPNPGVNDIVLVNDTIWIATSSGLAAADKTNHFPLKSPAAWTVYGIGDYPELGAENIESVVWFEGALYVATTKGMFRLDQSPSDTSFTPMPIGSGRSFFDLKVENDSLFFYYDRGMGVLKDSLFSSLSTIGLPSAPVTGSNTGAFRWVGIISGGMYQNSPGEFVEYVYTGPPGNDISDITVNKEGLVTAGFMTRKAAQYDGESWTVYPYDYADNTTNVISDSSGNTWIASWGNGVWHITQDAAVNYDETNSTLRGHVPWPTFVVVQGLTTDGRYLFAACLNAINGYPVAIGDLNNLDSPSGWDSLGVRDGLTNELVKSIDCYKGSLAVGTQGEGVFVCHLGDDPFDASRRYCLHYTVDSGLVSNNIRVVKYSPEGDLWVGTDRGLSRWDLDRFVVVASPEGVGPIITALEFDGRDNLWIGSERTGLARIDGATGASVVYTSRNSGLVSDVIINLALHPTNGDLYIATPSGISVLRSGVARFISKLEDIIAFPNPFVIRSDSDSLKFNFSRSGTVRLFTVAGELVAELPVNTPWNGRNQKGEKVVSGVYLYILTDNDGNVGRGKILVIREE